MTLQYCFALASVLDSTIRTLKKTFCDNENENLKILEFVNLGFYALSVGF